MKIVFLSPAAQGGGAEAALFEHLRSLCEARPEWKLYVIVAESGPFLEKLRLLAVDREIVAFPSWFRSFGENRREPVPTMPKRACWRTIVGIGRLVDLAKAAWGAFLYWRALGRRLRQLRPDIVHSNGMKMHLLGALARPRTARLVWHLHDYLSARPTMKTLLQKFERQCRLVVANSESVAVDARAMLPAGPIVRAVYNAVDFDTFTPDGPALDLDRLAGMPPAGDGTVRVGLVATFAFWKGHEVFLRAAATLAGNGGGIPVRFYVVGGPLYATKGSQHTVEELRATADALGVRDHVGFTGFVEDVPAAMRALDIVVHTSTEPEPFGLVIVQAMACGRAVVVSAAGGARELVEVGTTALAHSPGDAAGLADAVDRLAADAALRARLGAAANLHATSRFCRRRLAETVVPLYEALAADAL